MVTTEELRALIPGLVFTIYVGIVFGTMGAAYFVQRSKTRPTSRRGTRSTR